MTIWQPDLDQYPGPRYRAIADALAADMRAGTLKVGDRLPTHRDLAWRLGVTVGTITRAYAEAERRGLIAGEVGRGTYIRGPASLPSPLDLRHPTTFSVINFSQNHLIPGEEAALLADTLRDLSASPELAEFLPYQPHGGLLPDREAGALWLNRYGAVADPAHVLVTAGGQHGVTMMLSAFTNPGDVVATEAMTYVGFKVSAHLHHVRLEGIATDSHGIIPDALAAACRASPIRLLYLTPNLNNPSAGILDADRRRAIVEIARRHDLMILEDDIYGFLVPGQVPIATLAPERTVLLTSPSKCTAAGFRIGYMLAPPDRLDRLTIALRATMWMAPPLMARIMTRWINEGIAARLAAEKRAEAIERQTLARQYLGDLGPDCASAYHCWLALPDRWRAEDFTTEAHRRGVAVTPGSVFAVARTGARNGVRICLSPPRDRDEVRRGLQILSDLLAADSDPMLSVV